MKETSQPSIQPIELKIELGLRSYPIHINVQSFDMTLINARAAGRKVVVVTNETVAPLYLKEFTAQLESVSLSVCMLPDGESHKNVENWQCILNHLAEHHINRSDLLIALGGGVICDMSGFAAASWMRGIDVLQVPTTLLSQVDASVGGKTGINHNSGKNLIGAFHQPTAVVINSATLDTLPDNEFRSGLGEAIKYGFINQPDFLQWMCDNSDHINQRDKQTLAQLISQCCQFKADVVAADEKERGQRALLNLGHTFGHAIETMGDYKTFLHGEAVSIGTVMAAQLSENLGLAKSGLRQKVEDILHLFDLPVRLPQSFAAQKMVELMRLDKKALNSVHRLILMRAVGQAELMTDIKESDIKEAIEQCIS